MLSVGPKLGIRLSTPDGYTLPITTRCLNPVITTGPGGYQQFTSDIRLSKFISFMLYNLALGGEVILSWGGRDVWEGRIEDVALSQSVVSIVALGYSRALVDMPITLFMSESSYAGWRPINQEDNINADPSRAYFDNNNRVYLAPRKNSELDSTHWAGMGYARPHRSITDIYRATFDYEAFGETGKTYIFDFRRRTEGWNNISPALWTLSADGTTQTGSEDISISGGATNLSFMCYRGNATGDVYTGETGEFYLKITNLRLYGIDDTEITAKDVIGELVSHINSVNPTQLSAETGQVADPGLDLTDQIYEDAQAIDIIEGLQGLGDDQTPPRYWRASVWEGKRVQFQPVGKYAREYQVNFGDLVINRSVDTAFTGFYTAYSDQNNRRLRTTQTDDPYALKRLGFSRVGVIDVSTTSQTQAEAARGAAVEDSRYSIPFSAFTVKKLFSSLQTAAPLYLLRSGDNITIRNWPPILGGRQDRVRTFKVLMTSLDLRTGDLTVTPEQYPRSLDQMIARRGEGV